MNTRSEEMCQPEGEVDPRGISVSEWPCRADSVALMLWVRVGPTSGPVLGVDGSTPGRA